MRISLPTIRACTDSSEITEKLHVPSHLYFIHRIITHFLMMTPTLHLFLHSSHDPRHFLVRVTGPLQPITVDTKTPTIPKKARTCELHGEAVISFQQVFTGQRKEMCYHQKNSTHFHSSLSRRAAVRHISFTNGLQSEKRSDEGK